MEIHIEDDEEENLLLNVMRASSKKNTAKRRIGLRMFHVLQRLFKELQDLIYHIFLRQP